MIEEIETLTGVRGGFDKHRAAGLDGSMSRRYAHPFGWLLNGGASKDDCNDQLMRRRGLL